MFTDSGTHVKLAIGSLLITTILIVPTRALPSGPSVRSSRAPDDGSKDKHCDSRLPHAPTDNHPVRFHTWWIFLPVAAVFFAAFLFIKRHGRRVTQNRPPRPGCNHSVSVGEPVRDDAHQPPRKITDDTHDASPQPFNNKGKSPSIASASDGATSHRNVLQGAVSRSSSIVPPDRCIDSVGHDITSGAQVTLTAEPSLSHDDDPHLLIARWYEVLDDPLSRPPQTRHTCAKVGPARSSSVPDPRILAVVTRLQSRYDTLSYDIESEPSPSNPTETKPLHKSLYSGSVDLSVPPTDNLSVFFVAADDELEDPDHDLGVFQTILHQPTDDPAIIPFSSLAENDLTLGAIKRRFIRLYLLAFITRSRLVVFLAGRGLEAGMCLPNGAYISEKDVFEWLSTVRLPGAQIPTIILDICRQHVLTSFNAGNLANMIRSCSPGELAGAIGFVPKNISRSCFYISFFLAANDRRPCPKTFKEALVHWLGRVGKLRSRIHDFYHTEPEECESCKNGRICDQPQPQTLEQGDEGWSDLYQLGVFIATKHPGPVRDIVDRFHQEEKDMELWSQRNRASTSQSPQSAPIAQNTSAVAQHSRGTTPSVVQAESPSIIVEGGGAVDPVKCARG